MKPIVETQPRAVTLVGTQIHAVTREEAVAQVRALAHRPPAMVVTPNVDHAVLLQGDAAFRHAYDAAALRLCDGAPLLALSRVVGRPLPGRVTGADLMGDVCELAAQEGLRVFVAGGAPDVLRQGMANLRQRYPGLVVSGHSPPLHFERTEHEVELQRVLREAKPDIVMVCLGAPRAELWAEQQLDVYPAVYLCVGAAIDFAAGTRLRAPAVLQQLGLEWLYRLAQEPRRLWQRYLVRDAAFLPLALREVRSSVVGRGPTRDVA